MKSCSKFARDPAISFVAMPTAISNRSLAILFITAFAISSAGDPALGGNNLSGNIPTWAGDIETDDAETLASFAEGDYTEQAAIALKRTGTGAALTVAGIGLDDTLRRDLFGYLLGLAGIPYWDDLPEHVRRALGREVPVTCEPNRDMRRI